GDLGHGFSKLATSPSVLHLLPSHNVITVNAFDIFSHFMPKKYSPLRALALHPCLSEFANVTVVITMQRAHKNHLEFIIQSSYLPLTMLRAFGNIQNTIIFP